MRRCKRSRRCAQQYAPSLPLDYSFIDEEFDKKFSAEERIGKLQGSMQVLAVFISFVSVFLGLASFMAEQRIKEIKRVRKVLGASVVDLWALLSKDFLGLVGVALVDRLAARGVFNGALAGALSLQDDDRLVDVCGGGCGGDPDHDAHGELSEYKGGDDESLLKVLRSWNKL